MHNIKWSFDVNNNKYAILRLATPNFGSVLFVFVLFDSSLSVAFRRAHMYTDGNTLPYPGPILLDATCTAVVHDRYEVVRGSMEEVGYLWKVAPYSNTNILAYTPSGTSKLIMLGGRKYRPWTRWLVSLDTFSAQVGARGRNNASGCEKYERHFSYYTNVWHCSLVHVSSMAH